MKLQDVTQIMQGVGAIGGLIFAFMAYWKGRGNQRKIEAVGIKADAVHDLVNGQSEILRTAAYAKGASDQRQDSRDAAQLSRDIATEAAKIKEANGGQKA